MYRSVNISLTKLLFLAGEAFYHLDSPVIRVTGVDAPMPYTKSLEAAALPQPHDIVRAIKRVLNIKL
jgi:pyruvate dehydrogenase E1 component beta subunit